MKSIIMKLLAALLVVGALAGCASTGEQETAMDWVDRTYNPAD